MPPAVAMMAALPAITAVTLPLLLTVATLVSVDFQVVLLSVASDGVYFTVRVEVAPSSSVRLVLLRLMEVKATVLGSGFESGLDSGVGAGTGADDVVSVVSVTETGGCTDWGAFDLGMARNTIKPTTMTDITAYSHFGNPPECVFGANESGPGLTDCTGLADGPPDTEGSDSELTGSSGVTAGTGATGGSGAKGTGITGLCLGSLSGSLPVSRSVCSCRLSIAAISSCTLWNRLRLEGIMAVSMICASPLLTPAFFRLDGSSSSSFSISEALGGVLPVSILYKVAPRA